MNKRLEETFGEYLVRLKKAAATLTPDQIAACAWVIGGSGCGWTPETVVEALNEELKNCHGGTSLLTGKPVELYDPKGLLK